MLNETLRVWTFDRDITPDVASRALEQRDVPDLEVVLVSARGDVVTVQVVDGAIGDPDDILYVAGRGLYELLRSETWPPATAGGAPRVLLTLKAWPNA